MTSTAAEITTRLAQSMDLTDHAARDFVRTLAYQRGKTTGTFVDLDNLTDDDAQAIDALCNSNTVRSWAHRVRTMLRFRLDDVMLNRHDMFWERVRAGSWAVTHGAPIGDVVAMTGIDRDALLDDYRTYAQVYMNPEPVRVNPPEFSDGTTTTAGDIANQFCDDMDVAYGFAMKWVEYFITRMEEDNGTVIDWDNITADKATVIAGNLYGPVPAECSHWAVVGLTLRRIYTTDPNDRDVLIRHVVEALRDGAPYGEVELLTNYGRELLEDIYNDPASSMYGTYR